LLPIMGYSGTMDDWPPAFVDALAVLHPPQVRQLILAATQAGTGRSRPVPLAAAAILTGPNPAAAVSLLFPENQSGAAQEYVQNIRQYKPFYSASSGTKDRQVAAIGQWAAGRDRAGRELAALRLPTLVADGKSDELDATANDRLLASTIPRAQLILYPDARHAFLFQDAPAFVAQTERFLK
jgi:pimeloyl-ACP methyl ester carboxylesterase